MNNSEKVPWNDEYKLGIESIDTQHERLFALVNRLFEAEEHHTSREELRDMLYAFSDYMNTHFKDEEEYMSSIGYPGLLEHKQLHNELVNYLTSVIKTPGKINIIKTKMRLLAKRILIEHIVNEDIKIKLYEMSRANPDRLIFDNSAIDIDEEAIDITDIEVDDYI